MLLNLVFHNIVSNSKQLNNKYTVTHDYYVELIEKLNQKIKDRNTLFSDYHIYFDDGYVSFNEFIYPSIGDYSKFTLAIVTDDINRNGFLNDSLLNMYDQKGIIISSHGISHSTLGFYKNGVLQDTFSDGPYKNSPKGQKKVLSENEVLYQLKESKTYLEKLVGHKINEFVLPYGIYNETTLLINKSNHLYKNISTCDEYLDDGDYLKPRFLIDHEKDIETTIDRILELGPCIKR